MKTGRQRGADQEAPRFHARDQVDAARRACHVPERLDDVTEGLAVGEEPGDVAEGDARPGVGPLHHRSHVVAAGVKATDHPVVRIQHARVRVREEAEAGAERIAAVGAVLRKL